ncbi:hypothetical protein J4219_06790 [Candidatus Woesearchaeota archaeon]|nr:hypothetical protein [Candidatus Woesearchaeota archaeon]
MAKWLNPRYSDDVLAQAGVHFKNNGALRLIDFLSPAWLKVLSAKSWQKAHNPLKYSYSVSKAPDVAKSSEFKNLISTIVGHKIRLSALTIAKFSKGDYSLLYDSLKSGKGVLFFLDLNSLSETEGSYAVFVKGDTEVLRVIPERNSLVLVRYDGLRFFTKYLNHRAKSERIFLIGVALPK